MKAASDWASQVGTLSKGRQGEKGEAAKRASRRGVASVGRRESQRFGGRQKGLSRKSEQVAWKWSSEKSPIRSAVVARGFTPRPNWTCERGVGNTKTRGTKMGMGDEEPGRSCLINYRKGRSTETQT